MLKGGSLGRQEKQHSSSAFSGILLSTFLVSSLLLPPASALVGARHYSKPQPKSSTKKVRQSSSVKRKSARKAVSRKSTSSKSKKLAKAPAKATHRPSAPIPPQAYLSKMNRLTLKPGVVYWFYHGALKINVVDVDMKTADVKVRPYLANKTFEGLKTTERHADDSGALVAVNANYFKADGTPLGAIKLDGEWVSGSLFNRVAMGITDEGDVKFARVNLHGILKTSNPEASSVWINNMNQPRRTGVKAILYTPRWGDNVTMAYDGVVVAVDSQGKVVEIQKRSCRIPAGGYVITDREDSQLAHLVPGEYVSLKWHTRPNDWNDVVHAISGGPTLIKKGELFVGLKGERFPLSWTSSKITRRTACGFTGNKHLIMATIEGPHNMWDLSKFMQALGCVEAMNLDGGGSTTMVVAGKTVTGNTSGQRKVAATLTVMEPQVAARHRTVDAAHYRPATDLLDFISAGNILSNGPRIAGIKEADSQQVMQNLLVPGLVSNSGLLTSKSNSPKVIDYRGSDVIDIDNDLYPETSRVEPVDASPVAKARTVQPSEQSRPERIRNGKTAEPAESKPVIISRGSEPEIPGQDTWRSKLLKKLKFAR